jgi:protein-tyrosine kinase
MSRVYDALQQCVTDQVSTGIPHESKVVALFPEQFANTTWDPQTASAVQPDLSSQEKFPVLFSAYSFASEQFRLLATRLQQSQLTRALKSVLLTSSVEGDGKSLMALNLGFSLAQGGRQTVLIIDADLRKPGLSSDLQIDSLAGLREWYRSDRPVAEFIYKIADSNVWVLPTGAAAVDPLELLKSPRIQELLTSLNAAFDWVLVDSTPLLPLADAEVISRLCDGTVVIVRREKSPKTALKQALERVAPSKLVGLLLNDFPSAKNGDAASYMSVNDKVRLNQQVHKI